MSRTGLIEEPYIRARKPKIIKMAKQYEWELLDQQDDIGMISFLRSGIRLNIYWTRMTVSTSMHHPVKGKTQLHRRGVDFTLLEKIMKNPRYHTRIGYYQK